MSEKERPEAAQGLSEAFGEPYRRGMQGAVGLQERSTDLVQGFFGDVTAELREGMQNSQAMAKSLMDGSEKQMEAFQKMLGEAMETYMNLLNAPLFLYQKNLEAFGKRGE